MPRSYQHRSASERLPYRRRTAVWRWIIVISLLLLGLVVYRSFEFSPWLKALLILLIRSAFDKGAMQISQALEKHILPGVDAILDRQYCPHDPDANLDLFYPHALPSPVLVLPTIVWVVVPEFPATKAMLPITSRSSPPTDIPQSGWATRSLQGNNIPCPRSS